MLCSNLYEYIIRVIHYYNHVEEDVSFCFIGKFEKNSYTQIQVSFDTIKNNYKNLFCSMNSTVFNDLKNVFKDKTWVFLNISEFIYYNCTLFCNKNKNS